MAYNVLLIIYTDDEDETGHVRQRGSYATREEALAALDHLAHELTREIASVTGAAGATGVVCLLYVDEAS